MNNPMSTYNRMAGVRRWLSLAWVTFLAMFLAGCAGGRTAQPIAPETPPPAQATITSLQPATQPASEGPARVMTQTPAPAVTATPLFATTELPSPGVDFPVGRLAILHSGKGRYLYLLTADSHDPVGYYAPEDGGKCPYQNAFSQDGRWLAYVASGDLVVGQWQKPGFATAVHSEDLATVLPPTGGGWIEPADLNWVPGSAHLLFTTIEQGVPFPSARLDLYRYDAETGKLERLLTNDQGGSIYPDPTGRQVALANDSQIGLLDLKTGKVRKVLEYPQILTHTEYFYTPVVDWAPDGSFFQTTVPPEDPVVNPGDPTAIWRVDATTGEAKKLGEIVAGFQARRAYFSPDGRRLAYQYLDTLSGPGKIYVADADGQDAHIMLEGIYMLGGWTQSGDYLVVYDQTARQFLGLAVDGSQIPIVRQGAILRDEALAYQPLDQQLVSDPRLLNDRGQVCAWTLLSAGSVDETGVKPLVLPTSTPSPIPTAPPLPTAKRKPPATPLPTATLLPGVGEYRVQVKLQGHAEAVNGVAFRPSTADTLASAGKDGLIYLWSLPAGSESGRFKTLAAG
jgi:hypothetical protein